LCVVAGRVATFRVMGPMDDHDHLMKHMIEDAGVRRFSRT
jgi:hypothetical protein